MMMMIRDARTKFARKRVVAMVTKQMHVNRGNANESEAKVKVEARVVARQMRNPAENGT